MAYLFEVSLNLQMYDAAYEICHYFIQELKDNTFYAIIDSFLESFRNP